MKRRERATRFVRIFCSFFSGKTAHSFSSLGTSARCRRDRAVEEGCRARATCISLVFFFYCCPFQNKTKKCIQQKRQHCARAPFFFLFFSNDHRSTRGAHTKHAPARLLHHTEKFRGTKRFSKTYAVQVATPPKSRRGGEGRKESEHVIHLSCLPLRLLRNDEIRHGHAHLFQDAGALVHGKLRALLQPVDRVGHVSLVHSLNVKGRRIINAAASN